MATNTKWFCSCKVVFLLLPLVACLPCPPDGKSYFTEPETEKTRPCEESMGMETKCVQHPEGHLQECCNPWLFERLCTSQKPVTNTTSVGSTAVPTADAVNEETILGLSRIPGIFLLVVIVIASIIIATSLFVCYKKRDRVYLFFSNRMNRKSKPSSAMPVGTGNPEAGHRVNASTSHGRSETSVKHGVNGKLFDIVDETTAEGEARRPLLGSPTGHCTQFQDRIDGQQVHPSATPQSEPPPNQTPEQTATTSTSQSSDREQIPVNTSVSTTRDALQQQPQNDGPSSSNNAAQSPVTVGVGTDGNTHIVITQTTPNPRANVPVANKSQATCPNCGTAQGSGGPQAGVAAGAGLAASPSGSGSTIININNCNIQGNVTGTHNDNRSSDRGTGRNSMTPRAAFVHQPRQNSSLDGSSSDGDPSPSRIHPQPAANTAHSNGIPTVSPAVPQNQSDGVQPNTFSPAQLPPHYPVHPRTGHDSDTPAPPTLGPRTEGIRNFEGLQDVDDAGLEPSNGRYAQENS